MAASSPIVHRRFDSAGARAQRDVVSQIHRDAYSDRIATGDEFASDEAFMTRFDAYTARDGFGLIIAYVDSEPTPQPVGQTWGWPLPPETKWWEGLEDPPDPDFTQEDGHRTFALSEIMVGRPWTGKGIARSLHDELLRPRTEKRATLLVRPDNPAYAIYERWGWRKAARLRPGWPGAPLMDVLMLPLPLNPSRTEGA
ncbi:GNAT family N-acetyltransferase [Actinomadura bangladeshensis]|uniref:GNAT family N-acetyltransferase n=1 Tax=Actinomadura bangladeshensis TaxID=453573 RepID=A0A4R4NDF1_9ACTN|nr:GNAT family N-acetyltransferase [Actinomadura bangladeshensis]TDC07178.1 GNAT family N-acetyltransferase [Actinomadura bangladeshensis]